VPRYKKWKVLERCAPFDITVQDLRITRVEVLEATRSIQGDLHAPREGQVLGLAQQVPERAARGVLHHDK